MRIDPSNIRFAHRDVQSNPARMPLVASEEPAVEGASEVVNQAEEEVGFADLLDILNPLQHIPIVSGMYRQATGDNIQAGSRLLGGLLFGGLMGSAVGGMLSALVDVALVDQGQEDVAGQILDRLGLGAQTEQETAAASGESATQATEGPMTAWGDADESVIPTIMHLASGVQYQDSSAREKVVAEAVTGDHSEQFWSAYRSMAATFPGVGPSNRWSSMA